MSEKPASSGLNRQIFPKFSLFGFFRWSILKRVLFVAACLVTLLVVVLAEENWRGKRAWEAYRREWEAKGERFDLKSFTPPPVPDDQNFAMTPFLAPLFDFNPRPLQPGQDLWRDTNVVNRTKDFASELFNSRSNAWHNRGIDNFSFFYKILMTNSLPAGSPFASRAEAAEALLKSLEEYRPVLDELSKAAHERPYSRFNIGYGDEDPASILLPHLAVCKRLGQIYELRALGELAAGRNDDALADTEMTFYVADSMKGEPFLISGLVRVAILNIALQPVRLALAEHRWSDAQLAQLEEKLRRYDLVVDCARDLRGERALGNRMMDYILGNRKVAPDLFSDAVNESHPLAFLRFIPGGWLYQNQINLNRMYQQYNLPGADAATHQFYPSRSAVSAWEGELGSGGFHPYMMFVRVLFPAVANAHRKYAFAQASVDEAAIACALERYRLLNAHLPETLAELSPAFIKTLPFDVIGGGPLKYRRNADGTFVLYSVGWNEKDDGGTVVMTRGTNHVVDITQGDWVWQQNPVK